MVTVDMQRKLQDEKCPEEGDVKAYLMKLQTIQEGLITMDTDPGNENFIAIVLGSLLVTYLPISTHWYSNTSRQDPQL